MLVANRLSSGFDAPESHAHIARCVPRRLPTSTVCTRSDSPIEIVGWPKLETKIVPHQMNVIKNQKKREYIRYEQQNYRDRRQVAFSFLPLKRLMSSVLFNFDLNLDYNFDIISSYWCL